jgi:hypothetical protein
LVLFIAYVRLFLLLELDPTLTFLRLVGRIYFGVPVLILMDIRACIRIILVVVLAALAALVLLFGQALDELVHDRCWVKVGLGLLPAATASSAMVAALIRWLSGAGLRYGHRLRLFNS